VQEAGLLAHQAIGARHFSRTDIILTAANVPVVLEINTIPGFTPTSLLPKAAACVGISFDELNKFVASPKKDPSFVLYHHGELNLCVAKNWGQSDLPRSLSKLGVTWSDWKVLRGICEISDEERAQKIIYERAVKKLWDKREEAQFIIFHAPLSMEDIMSVSDDRQYLPQKSTYFHPKLWAGLILRNLQIF
jgi:uncharacterized protein (DUF1015 family)